MKEILGIKRIVMLTVLSAIVLATASMLYTVIIPQYEDMTRDINSKRYETSDNESQARNLKSDTEEVKIQKERAALLKKVGFYVNQDRQFAVDTIGSIQKHTDVLKAQYQIEPIEEVKDTPLDEINYILLKSKMSFDIEAINDKDIYKFAYWIENSFPGLMILNSLEVKSLENVDDMVIDTIHRSGAVPLASGQLDFTWHTIVPRKVETEENIFDNGIF